MTATPGSPNAPTSEQIEELSQILRGQLDDYRQLLTLIDRKAEAIRHARLDAVADIFNQEKSIVERLGELERQRTRLLREVSSAVRPGADKALRVSDVAEAHPNEETRTRLLELGEELRWVATEVRNRSSKVRAGAEALARHMNGIMQSVRTALSRAGVYEQKGRLTLGTQLDFSVDVQS